ncbi:MAG: transcriptional regulator MntR [SAR116 cluster bacterium]|nr:transcriptional regulator MntR [SAR116 cluster bacterium]RPH08546.1 MAG: manganese-binding transcriptional regulator MntR [Alphaproteobacteria bacterium TMED54]|tara:strand:- start:87 stop:509 length:423 start_codon:yes stop_codon:yes gene_type:complete
MKYNNSTSSDRFFQIRNARNTEIAEDYTEMIADLINENGEARVVDLAKIFGVTSPTVNSVIRRLVRDGFVVSKPYRAIFLTEKGKTLAKNCKKRHETVYNFLISIGVGKENAKIDAEGIEHHVSSETLNIFEKFSNSNKK